LGFCRSTGALSSKLPSSAGLVHRTRNCNRCCARMPVEVSRGGWMLGEPAAARRRRSPFNEVVD
jgi:hypothetical protein